jgi:dynein heavy chain
MHWTSQIKEVVNEKDYVEHVENARPLSEIEYWSSRAQDLLNIKKQIQRSDVQQIVKILHRSTYLIPFLKQSEDIQKGSNEAMDNLKYLSTLREHCERLAKAEPKEIHAIVPEILAIVSFIVEHSTSYNSPERVTGLLRKVSNEIIYRCCQKISLEEIFTGNVYASMRSLEESISAGDYWRDICTTQSATLKYDKSSVFGEIIAFVLRCKELLEVCAAQTQFGSRAGGEDSDYTNKNGLPSFGGTRGPEITKNLLDIRAGFQKLITDLSNLKYPILDVKSTGWHDDFKKFKNGIRDLELRMQSVIASAFETVTDVENGIELLEAFSTLAKRDIIKRTVEEKTSEICLKFIKVRFNNYLLTFRLWNSSKIISKPIEKIRQ